MNNYYNLDSIILPFLSSTSCPLIICVEGIYHFCYWSMDSYDNESKNCIIEFIYGTEGNSIKLNCYWTIDNVVYNAENNIFEVEEEELK